MGIASVLFLLLVALNISHESAAQSAGCTTALISLSPCLNYITRSSSTPSSSCCSRLAKVLQSQPQGLCSALNGGAASLGVTVNQTQALELPGACGVQTPPVDRCNDASDPAAPAISPVGSPESPPVESSDDESAETPTATTWHASFPSEKGSKLVPATGGIPSGRGSIMKTSFYLILVMALLSSMN